MTTAIKQLLLASFLMALLVLAATSASGEIPSPARPYPNDGAADAPAGRPMLPGLLGGYTARPPWKVAGVDYAVGFPSGTALKNPATIVMAGVTVDPARELVTITGSNVTLSGYDFGLAGGWGIVLSGAKSDTVIENSNFHVGSRNNVPINAGAGTGNLTVLNNIMGGGVGQNVWALINYNGSGIFLAQYNLFVDAPDDAIDFNAGRMTTVVRYNVFANTGTDHASHPDPVQYVGVKSTNSIVSFNTIYQPNPSGMQGIQLQAQNGSVLVNTQIANNVIVAKAGVSRTMSYSIAIIQNSGEIIDTVTVSDNYIDYSGAWGPFYPPSGRNITFVGNMNMVSGRFIAAPPMRRFATHGADPFTLRR